MWSHTPTLCRRTLRPYVGKNCTSLLKCFLGDKSFRSYRVQTVSVPQKAVQTALGASGFVPVKRLPRSFAGRNRVATFCEAKLVVEPRDTIGIVWFHPCAEFFTGAENPAAHSVLLCTTVTQCPRFAPSQLILKRCSLFLLKSFIRTALKKCRKPAKECTERTFFCRQYS